MSAPLIAGSALRARPAFPKPRARRARPSSSRLAAAEDLLSAILKGMDFIGEQSVPHDRPWQRGCVEHVPTAFLFVQVDRRVFDLLTAFGAAREDTEEDDGCEDADPSGCYFEDVVQDEGAATP